MSTPTQSEIRLRNAGMLDKIRADAPKPHEEGRYVLRALTVPGRSSGLPHTVPMAVVQLDGLRYICAPDRQRDWVRNLLTAGRCELEGEPSAEHRVTLVEDGDAARAVHTYLAAMGRPSTAWPFPSDAAPHVIEQHTSTIAVFRIEAHKA